MTNKEKFKETIMNLAVKTESFAVKDGMPYLCSNIKCDECELKGFMKVDCAEKFNKWLNEEYNLIDWSKIPIDTPIFVRDFENAEWEKRHFAGINIENGRVFAWESGCTSWTTDFKCSWNFAKLAEPEKFMKEK